MRATIPGQSSGRSAMTLMEMLIVLSILAITTLIAVQMTSTVIDQGRFDATRTELEALRAAIIGLPATSGDQGVSGFVADLGVPPVTLDPLFTLPSGTLPYATYAIDTIGLGSMDSNISGGWRGPYMRLGIGNSLRDGWGNPFVYVIASPSGIITIQSQGAEGYDPALLTLQIAPAEYLASITFDIKEVRTDGEMTSLDTPTLASGDVLELRVFRPAATTGYALGRFGTTSTWPAAPPAPPSGPALGNFSGNYSHQLSNTPIGALVARAVLRDNASPPTIKKRSAAVSLTLAPRTDVTRTLILRTP